MRQGTISCDYQIRINGTLAASYTTSDTDTNTIKTNSIASTLAGLLQSTLDNSIFTITCVNSTIMVKNNTNTPFTISATDSSADNNLYAFMGEAESINAMPACAPHGYIMKVTGSAGDVADDYYVKFKAQDGVFSTGTWAECSAPDIKYALNYDTMPHALTRNSDGTFKFGHVIWTQRVAGDETTIKNPSFIGNTLQEIFTHKGRLGLLSSDKVFLTDSTDIFNCFKRSAMTELETDPIDITPNAKQVNFKHSQAFNEGLLLISDTTTFMLSGGSSFSNSTVSCDMLYEYPCSAYCKPIPVGKNVLCVSENGAHTQVREVYITSTYTTDTRTITEHIPAYILKGVYKMAASTMNNLVLFLNKNERNKIKVYNYHYTNETKDQQAFHTWTFGGDVLGLDFVENALYMYVQYQDGVYLEVINFSLELKEDNFNFPFYLDRKIYATPDENNQIELPYTCNSTPVVIDTAGFPLSFTQNDKILTLNKSVNKVVVGFTYESLLELPKLYKRIENTYSGRARVQDGTLIIQDVTLSYTDTGYFRVEVTPEYDTLFTNTYVFTGIIEGEKAARLGTIPVSHGTFFFPCMLLNTECNIKIINDDYTPFCLLSYDFVGDLVTRGINEGR